MTSDRLIDLAKRAGVIAYQTHSWKRWNRSHLPGMIERLAAVRRDGTLTACRRAYVVGLREGR
jgi:hypothetical protein